MLISYVFFIFIDEDEEEERSKSKRKRPSSPVHRGKPASATLAIKTPVSLTKDAPKLNEETKKIKPIDTIPISSPKVLPLGNVSIVQSGNASPKPMGSITSAGSNKSNLPVNVAAADTTSTDKKLNSPQSVKPDDAKSAANKSLIGSISIATNLVSSRGGSPGPQQPVNKWSHLGSGPGTPPRAGLGPRPGTPPRPMMSGHGVSASPPPYRGSPLPINHGAPGSPHTTGPSTVHQSHPPPPTTSHPPNYPPYHPERFPPHPAFAGYPSGNHSPNSHNGGPPRHPIRLPPGAPHPYSHGNFPPGHPGVLRGPPHEMYRVPPPQGRGSPNHPGSHPHLVMKPGYPQGPESHKVLESRVPAIDQRIGGTESQGSESRRGVLEPLPYASSPGSTGSAGASTGRHDSPVHPPTENKDDESGATGEFSSGLMSYFSSQREDDDE